jgi:uncharacterized membrane protein
MITRARHLAKAVTWRVIASIATALIAWTFGLPPRVIGAIFLVDLIVKFVLYYLHERVWYKHIKFGIKK